MSGTSNPPKWCYTFGLCAAYTTTSLNASCAWPSSSPAEIHFGTLDHRQKNSTTSMFEDRFRWNLGHVYPPRASCFLIEKVARCFCLMHSCELYMFIVFLFAFDGSLQVNDFVSPSRNIHFIQVAMVITHLLLQFFERACNAIQVKISKKNKNKSSQRSTGWWNWQFQRSASISTRWKPASLSGWSHFSLAPWWSLSFSINTRCRRLAGSWFKTSFLGCQWLRHLSKSSYQGGESKQNIIAPF